MGCPQAPQLEAYAKLPLGFGENPGQTDPKVKYVARGLGYTSYPTGTETVLAFTGSPANNTVPVKTCVQCAFGGGTTDAIVVDFQQIPLVVFSDYLGGVDADVG